MEPYKILKKLREEKKLTKAQVAKELGMPYSTYNHYELGDRKLDSKSIKLFSEFYNVSIDYLFGFVDNKQDTNPLLESLMSLKLTNEELMVALLLITNDEALPSNIPLENKIRIKKAADILSTVIIDYKTDSYNDTLKFINIYISLPDNKKREAFRYISYLANDDTIETSEELFILKNNVKLLGQTAAGQPLTYSDAIADDISNLSDVPANANFALTVKGDSMEPLIKNGSIVYIHSQEDVENGTISIVEIDGAVTCKKVYKENNQLKLVSINEKYEPMILDKGNVRILGKVIL